MTTVNKFLSAITDHKAIMSIAKEILHQIDPEYPDEEAKFHAGVHRFRDSLSAEEQATLDELLILEEKRMAANFLFLIWRGINQNLRCFQSHTAKQFINQDYEDIHDESVMEGMPANEKYWRLCSDFHHAISAEQNELSFPITSYYSYLATSAYKIAHYVGFSLADDLLYYLVPGYTPDPSTTIAYRTDIATYLNVDMVGLDG